MERCANRIGGAAFELSGETYQLDVNDGENNLDGHDSGSIVVDIEVG